MIRKRRGGFGPRGFWLGWAMLILMDLAALWGVGQLQYRDGLDTAFESTTVHYQAYETFLSQFDSDANDVFVLLKAPDLTTPATLARVEDFLIEVQFIPGVVGVLSPLSLRAEDGSALMSSDMYAAEIIERIDTLRARDDQLDRLLSPDRQHMVAALAVAPNAPDPDSRTALLRAVQAEVTRMMDTAGANGDSTLVATLTGLPVLRDQVVTNLFQDFFKMNILGAIIGTLVSALALRSIRLAAIVALTSGTGLLWTLGVFGALGLTINVVSVALPLLILILAFASALHLTFETRRQYAAGREGVISTALRRIGPACLMTAATTALAFAGLMLSPSSLVSSLGLAGALATLVSLTAVFLAHPMLLGIIARWKGLGWAFGDNGTPPETAPSLAALPAFAERYPRAISGGAIVLLCAAVFCYAKVTPQYTLYDNVDRKSAAYQSLDLIETQFSPVSSIKIPLVFDADTTAALPVVRGALTQIETLLHNTPHSLVSIANLANVAGDAATERETLIELERSLPETLSMRFISRDKQQTLINVMVRNEGAEQARTLVADLGERLSTLTISGATLGAPTGLLAVSSYLSRDMLLDLNLCFLAAVALSGLLITLWLRNPLLGLLALIPNVLPIALIGGWLTLSGNGLEFSSGIALTIAFGLAIDDTVHVLNRLRLNATPGVPISIDLIRQSVNEVAPVLFLTSLILSAGLISTFFASLPSVSYFGGLSIAAFMLALVADLLVLPALLFLLVRHRQVILHVPHMGQSMRTPTTVETK